MAFWNLQKFGGNECQKIAENLPFSQISKKKFWREPPVYKGFNGHGSYTALVTQLKTPLGISSHFNNHVCFPTIIKVPYEDANFDLVQHISQLMP